LKLVIYHCAFQASVILILNELEPAIANSEV
jgi:hypothetical protein